MARTPKRIRYISISDIKSRGWTDKMIATFLKTPDLERVNPLSAHGLPVPQYLLSRVDKIEKTQRFIRFIAERSKRQNLSMIAADVRRLEKVDMAKTQLGFGW